jgi:hypothetical protein
MSLILNGEMGMVVKSGKVEVGLNFKLVAVGGVKTLSTSDCILGKV